MFLAFVMDCGVVGLSNLCDICGRRHHRPDGVSATALEVALKALQGVLSLHMLRWDGLHVYFNRLLACGGGGW